ncbi:MAG: hypothetical protein DHS20C02_03460 [Micavibrio sp.]|nr:MAG: hypothetical protein DHS20C02_03460 [Micavibrio sp.]
MKNKISTFILSLFLCAGLLQPATLHAQEQAEEENRRPITLKVNYDNIESAGLYSNAREGSLGKDLWDNTQRSYLIGLIEELPQYISSRTLRKLNKRALLSETNSRLINNDVEIEPGRDLLTVRIEKLLDMGLYAEAFDLYSLLNKESYHERLARTGILAMLYNGEKPLACVEANTLGNRFTDQQFWQELNAYCNLSLSDKPEKRDVQILKSSGKNMFQTLAAGGRYNFTYAPKKFEKLSQLEQAVLIAEKSLKLGNLDAIKFSDIPARHLGLLLGHEKITLAQKVLLSIQAVDKNILETKDLKKLYEQFANDNLVADSLAGWQKPAYYYLKVKNAKKDADQWNIIRTHLFPVQDKYGAAALAPAAEIIQKLEPEAVNLSDIGHAIRVLQVAGLSIPPHWSEALEAIYSKNIASSDEYKRLYLSTFLAKTEYRRSDLEKERVETFLKQGKSSYTAFLRNIIENLDKSYEGDHNASKVYEKDFDLTSTEDYVMPSVDVWDRLVLVSRNRNIGETILLSTFALQGAPMENFYPGVLRNVLMSFNTVGLTNISREMVIETLLEI